MANVSLQMTCIIKCTAMRRYRVSSVNVRFRKKTN